MKRPDKEMLLLITAGSLTFTGFGAMYASIHKDTSGISAKISDREDAIAATLGRPSSLEIAGARNVLIPAVTSPQREEYFGDEERCSPAERKFRIVDAACGVLDLAREKEGEFRAASILDDTLNKLILQQEEQRLFKNRLLWGGNALILAGFLTVIAHNSEATRRRKIQLNFSR